MCTNLHFYAYLCRKFTNRINKISMRTVISENILPNDKLSFLFREDMIPFHEEIGYHAHPEFELMCLTDCGGKRIVNEIEEMFEEYDVALMPEGIPHGWILDPMLCPADGIVHDCCVQFSKHFLKNLSYCFPEFEEMVNFYCELRQGMILTGDTAQRVIQSLHSFGNMNPRNRFHELLGLLIEIYDSGNFRLIGSPVHHSSNIVLARQRFELVNKLVVENYSRHISLSEAAELVNLNPTAFCNAFKSSTGTTFNRFLTNYRMQVATRLLTTTLLSIKEIASKTGFEDVPNFFRLFKKHFNVTPTEYRNKFTPR